MMGPERGRYRQKVAQLGADAAAAERAGFTSVWLPQIPGDFDAFVAITLAAQATSRIELGTAVLPIQTRHPIAMAHKAAGNRVISIIGARTRELLVMEEEMRATSEELFVATDDGSYGRQGFVTDLLKELIAREGAENIAEVVAIGPVPMMRACAHVTEPHKIHTEVSLNPIMVDATGMCGACMVPVTLEGKMVRKHACIDGPELDAHLIDWDKFLPRFLQFRKQEDANKVRCGFK